MVEDSFGISEVLDNCSSRVLNAENICKYLMASRKQCD